MKQASSGGLKDFDKQRVTVKTFRISLARIGLPSSQFAVDSEGLLPRTNHLLTKKITAYRAYSAVPIIRPGRLGVTALIFPPKGFFCLVKEKKIPSTFHFIHLTNFEKSPNRTLNRIKTLNRKLRVFP